MQQTSENPLADQPRSPTTPAPVQIDIRPIVDPLLALLRSRGVMVALFTLLGVVVTVYIPNLDPRITTALEVLGGAIIAKIGVEDVAAHIGAGLAAKNNKPE